MLRHGPTAQHTRPDPHSAFVAQVATPLPPPTSPPHVGPHRRLVGSQHSPTWQSPSVRQHASHDPSLQHSPAPHWASAQHVDFSTHAPPQQRPVEHCASLVQAHVPHVPSGPQHWRT